MKKHYSLKNGQVMIMGIVVLVVVLILAASLFGRTSTFIGFGAKSVLNEQATQVAEAGIDYAVQKLNDTAGSYPGSNQTLSVGTAAIQVATKSQNLKSVTVTGYIPNAAAPRAKRTIKTDVLIDTTIMSFNYAVQVGTGGITMGQSSRINGSVYSNKPGNQSINGSQGSVVTGNTWTVGTFGNNPAVWGSKNEDQPPSDIPTFDYQKWKDEATDGGVIDCAVTPSLCSLTGGGTATIGNKKYLGKLTFGQSKQVIMNGPVYTTLGLDMGQSSSLTLDNSFGSLSTVFISDGTIDVGQGGTINPTNANPKGYIMVVTTSTDTNAIEIGQGASNAIFYALEGGVRLGQSGRATAIITKTLTLGQSAELTYDQGLATTQLSDGPGGSWQIKKGTYRQTSSP